MYKSSFNVKTFPLYSEGTMPTRYATHILCRLIFIPERNSIIHHLSYLTTRHIHYHSSLVGSVCLQYFLPMYDNILNFILYYYHSICSNPHPVVILQLHLSLIQLGIYLFHMFILIYLHYKPIIIIIHTSKTNTMSHIFVMSSPLALPT